MELFRLLGEISIDNTQADAAIEGTTNKAKKSESDVSNAFKSIGKVAGTIATGIGTAAGALGGAWIAAIEGTREYRVSMGKLETAFTTAGHSADTAQQTYSDLNAVLGDSDVAVEAASHLALLADNQEDLQTWTNIATGVFATFGDSLPIEGLAEASNETAKTGQLTGGLVDALNWAGISEEKFQDQLDACTNEQERQNLIMDTLDKTYKNAAETYKETNKDVIAAEKANEKLSKAMADVGAIGEPILTAIKEKVAEMATEAIPHLQAFVEKVQEIPQWIKENEAEIHKWVAAILGATVSIGTFLLILNWGSIMAAASKAVNTVKTAVMLFNKTLLANPIGLVVAAIVGLVATFIYLWNTNEDFRKFWIDLWKKIVSSAKEAWKSIKEAFSNVGSWFKEKFKAVKDGGKEAMDSVKKFFSDAHKKVKEIWSNIGGWFKEKAKSIRDGFSDSIGAIPKKASEIFQKVKSNISDKMDAARDAVKKVVDKIKGFFDFKFKTPKIPVPKFSISPSGWKVGDLLKGEKPSLSIKWNAEGGILDNPAIFGMVGNTLLGGGEKGPEAIAPISTLQAYIEDSVNRHNNDFISAIEIQVSRLILFLSEHLPSEYKIMLDSGVLVGEMDALLGDKYKKNTRLNNL